ncbi:aminoacyl-tRNA hydrolase [Candidatus Methylacidithermus pantelleriae]|uniref:Peptidyl-tRNA hydrolase n=1 Tax=Candidatus Methylacidithermus pantelleriae TaxID=2744239 RepID=A0A8J2BK48_9BACT|nr:aminoacyl-tRNA hydrolase [Candidatus Methylacidithermus pantelleriae]CAF0701797.1 Peptidyl-tRNA hydrolase [Candidatus Methylacidithermus pantelleriae]
MTPRLIVGLGNPGETYRHTRHNLGFAVVEELARQKKVVFKKDARGDWEAAVWDGDRWLVKPLSYMNLSGPVVATCLETLGLGPELLLVVVDDLSLPVGKIRLRSRGSSGGHRGLASIERALGTQAYARLRCGIGPLPAGVRARDFVLARFREEEAEVVESMIRKAVEAIQYASQKGLAAAMSLFNSGSSEKV